MARIGSSRPEVGDEFSGMWPTKYYTENGNGRPEMVVEIRTLYNLCERSFEVWSDYARCVRVPYAFIYLYLSLENRELEHVLLEYSAGNLTNYRFLRCLTLKSFTSSLAVVDVDLFCSYVIVVGRLSFVQQKKWFKDFIFIRFCFVFSSFSKPKKKTPFQIIFNFSNKRVCEISDFLNKKKPCTLLHTLKNQSIL